MIPDKDYLEILNENFGIKFTTCESSNIFAYAFKLGKDTKTGTLFIAFKVGKIYAYQKVPKEVFANLESAESKGKFVNANIVKESYKFFKYAIQENNK